MHWSVLFTTAGESCQSKSHLHKLVANMKNRVTNLYLLLHLCFEIAVSSLSHFPKLYSKYLKCFPLSVKCVHFLPPNSGVNPTAEGSALQGGSLWGPWSLPHMWRNPPRCRPPWVEVGEEWSRTSLDPLQSLCSEVTLFIFTLHIPLRFCCLSQQC